MDYSQRLDVNDIQPSLAGAGNDVGTKCIEYSDTSDLLRVLRCLLLIQIFPLC